jgi:hypothetical protein
MSVQNSVRFLSECIACAPGKQPGLSDDEVYGVYLSWCLLNAETPCSDGSLWAALSQQGYADTQDAPGRRVWPGLAMKGPAAVDYILSSQPSLV